MCKSVLFATLLFLLFFLSNNIFSSQLHTIFAEIARCAERCLHEASKYGEVSKVLYLYFVSKSLC